jgi:hypothetical protein
MEHILEDHGHTLLHRNEGAWPSYTEYHTGISEKVLELADLTDSSAGSRHVPTGTGLGPQNTICTGIPFGDSVVYGPNPSTTERKPEANRHDYLMVFMERRIISGTVIHITKDEEGGRLGYDTPSRKMRGAVFPLDEGTRTEEWEGDG